jgi:EmrB/QacA subfamily drug resistance transporter
LTTPPEAAMTTPTKSEMTTPPQTEMAAPTPLPSSPTLSPRRRIWTLVIVSVGLFMVVLDNLVVNTALPSIHRDLGASIQALEWTVNAYVLAYAVFLLTGAALGDRFGRKRMFMAGIALFTLSSAAAAAAPTIGLLIAARAVQGLGAAIATPLTLTLLAEAFPPERRGLALGFWSGISGIAVALGPLVGGAVTQAGSWHWIFWINVPIGAIAVPLVLTKMRESHGTDTSLDLPGLALVTGGVLGFVWALVRGNEAGWGAPEVVASFVLGALLIAAFVAWELRTSEPMLPMAFFRSRAFSAGNAAIFLTFASLFSAVFFYAQLLQTGLGYDALGAGLRLMPWTATFITVAPVVGALVDKVGERPFMVAGLSLQATGLAWLALIAEPGMAYSQMLAPFIVGGVGVSMAIPAAQNSVLGSMAESALGKAAGANSMMRELGGVFGVAVVVAVFAGAGSFASPQAFTDGFEPAILVAAGLALLGAAAGLALPGRRTAAFVPRVQEATS